MKVKPFELPKCPICMTREGNKKTYEQPDLPDCFKKNGALGGQASICPQMKQIKRHHSNITNTRCFLTQKNRGLEVISCTPMDLHEISNFSIHGYIWQDHDNRRLIYIMKH